MWNAVLWSTVITIANDIVTITGVDWRGIMNDNGIISSTSVDCRGSPTSVNRIIARTSFNIGLHINAAEYCVVAVAGYYWCVIAIVAYDVDAVARVDQNIIATVGNSIITTVSIYSYIWIKIGNKIVPICAISVTWVNNRSIDIDRASIDKTNRTCTNIKNYIVTNNWWACNRTARQA